MAIRTIVSVCVLDQSDDDIKAAAALCAEAGAHLALVVAAIAEPPPVGEYAAELSIEWQELRQNEMKRLADKAAHARQLLAAYDISFDVETEYAERAWMDNAIGLRAHYCDLVFLSRAVLGKEDLSAPLLEGSLFHSARPVLIAPAGMTPPLKPETVLIAWDSRQEAARAVQASLEFLSQSKEVHIALVDPVASDLRNGAEPGADIAAYLARHGLNITVDRLPSGGRPAAEVLKQHATDIDADLLVMGAYGHSRLRERIFGGMTRAFIEEAGLPLLMAH